MLASLLEIRESRPPWFVANFDSASGLVKSLGNCLHGKGFPGAGSVPESELLATVINALPWKLQRAAYVKGSAKGAIEAHKMKKIVGEEFSEWATDLYPKKEYPAILIGSSSGPAVHLGAAMGIPWLPQTFLIPVQTPNLPVDEPKKRIEWSRKPAAELLNANPHLQLHHMMDPNQDRPMLKNTSYFRVKYLHLDPAYKQFILQHLEKNGTIYIIDCQKSWPVTHVDDRYYFQFGGLGGTTIDEYLNGSEAVKEYLKKCGSPLQKWDAPAIDTVQPEAEWGFIPTLQEDIMQLANEHGYKVQRVVFNEPEDFSPFVADLYRWWYEQRNIPDNKLLVGMFFLIEPYWTICTGSVPFWLAFNARPSVACINEYLEQAKSYDEIYMMPFSHGVKGMGLATTEDLKSVLAKARVKGDFLGSEPDLYPFDFGIYARYEKDLKKKLTERYPVNVRLTIQQLNSFIEASKGKYKVDWQEVINAS